jgi:hypothetical protein
MDAIVLYGSILRRGLCVAVGGLRCRVTAECRLDLVAWSEQCEGGASLVGGTVVGASRKTSLA